MKYPLTNSIVVLAELTIKQDKLDEFLDNTLANLDISRTATGNIRFDILIDEIRPEQVIFYEVWETAEAQQAYMAWRVERGDLTKLVGFLADEPKFTTLKNITE